MEYLFNREEYIIEKSIGSENVETMSLLSDEIKNKIIQYHNKVINR